MSHDTTHKAARRIAVIGGRSAGAEDLFRAEALGALLAKGGHTLLTGGLGGVMEAASRGAHLAGGLTVGILPGEDASEANAYLSMPIATGMGLGRNVILIRSAEAVIAIGGGHGTLSEIAHALQMGKPVAGLGTWGIEGVLRAGDVAEALKIVLDRLPC